MPELTKLLISWLRRENKMKKQSRREFIKVFTMSGTGLFLAAYTPMNGFFKPGDDPKIFSPSVYLKIDNNGIVTIIVHRSELGQGVRTSLPMLVAEELEVEWENIRVEQADGHPKYGNQTTGGSQSIRKSYEPFRVAGATAREMLIAAAAIKWGVDVKKCYAEKGYIVNKSNGKKLSYGELVDEASKLPVPENVLLKDPEDFQIIGKRIHRTDTPDKIYGKAKFGIDLVIPGMYYAAVQRCPAIGGSAKSFNDSKTKSINGVVDVVKISRGIAVIANSTWSSFKGKDALVVDWDLGPNANVNSEIIRKNLESKLNEEGSDIEIIGKPNSDFSNNINIEAVYEVPFLAHAPMEPMTCIAEVKNGKAELWAPSQNPQGLRSDVAKALGFNEDDVIVHVVFAGGAFGRKLVSEYGIEAAEISKASGKIIKLTWTREDDMKHGVFRPASMHKLKGAVDGNGNPVLFGHHVIAESISAQRFYRALPVKDSDLGEGTKKLSYKIPNIKISGSIVPTHVPVSWYRSVYHTQNPFAVESFLDEMAFAANKDPYEFRKKMLPDNSRLKAVLIKAAEKSGWYNKLEAGKGRGIACAECYESYIAQVAEVTVINNKVKVDKVTCVIDCGIVINPDSVEAQLEGAIGFALSYVLKSKITIENGGVAESNFDEYEILTLNEMPKVEIEIMKNTYKVGGVGETGIAALAPAVCNAIFAASGKRIRRLPVELS
ncbi:MAG: molybdopterin-dependent oxidoreductase [Bacteroidetes bacterium]|nr:molybdopterin-dependent oxidoreductase [Bacteroidota bacterium]